MEKDEYTQIEREYTVQHFGFDPSVLVEEMSELSVEHLSCLLGKIKEQIQKKKAGKFDKEELDKCVAALDKKFSEYSEKKFNFLGAYLNESIFKIPPHALLKEDAAWDNLKKLDAKVQLLSVNAEMEKMRERYKTSLHKRKYLREYLDKLKQICIHQEEAIQRQVSLKESSGLPRSEETLGYLRSKEAKLHSQLHRLREVAGSTAKRKAEMSSFARDKKLKLENDIKLKQEVLRS